MRNAEYGDAAEAIAESIAHNRIVRIEDTPGNREYLRRRCDDHVDIGPEVEYWGDENGNEWRVHVVVIDEDVE